MILTTGRQLEHWHTGAMTRKASNLNAIEPEASASLSPKDILKNNITPGDMIKVSTRRGEINIQPVSVCHHVSTIGHLPSPTVLKYHIQASGLIGSPTVPKSFKDFLLVFLTGPSPSFIRAHNAVGEV